MKRVTMIGLSLLFIINTSFGQEKSKPEYEFGADIATMYLWRGYQLGNGPVIQPWGIVSYKNLTLGAWSSTNFTGSFQEIDLFAKYQYKKLTIAFTDLFFPGYEGLDPNFFNFRNSSTGHAAELGLSYDVSSKFPLTVSGGVIIYGRSLDSSPGNPGLNNFSTFFEARYSGKINKYKYSAFAGITPTESYFYNTHGFGFVNTGFSIEKTIPITEKFELPAKFTLAANPANNKVFAVFQLSI